MKHPYLQTGKIVSTHGVRGEVKLLPWADGPEFLLQFHTLYLDGQPYHVEQSRVQKTCVLVKLAGIDTVEAASGSTDLGLSIAKLLTEKMGGRIWAAYENETLQVFVDFPQ